MKVATWNVNSIRSRLERAVNWLGKHQPDVLCLQELKTVDDNFPFEDFTRAVNLPEDMLIQKLKESQT